MFLRDTGKLFLKNLDIETLLQKIGSISCIGLSQRSAKKFAHHPIPIHKFCKELQKFACFRTFGRKRACCRIMKKWKNLKFYSYWVTDHPSIQFAYGFFRTWSLCSTFGWLVLLDLRGQYGRSRWIDGVVFVEESVYLSCCRRITGTGYYWQWYLEPIMSDLQKIGFYRKT